MATAAPPAPPAPPAAQGDNRVHLYRLLTLTVDEGTSIVRYIFDDKRPTDPLNVFLASEKASINRLRASKTITKAQYDLLFPASRTPTTADFDLTLTICLLRNLPTFGFNKNPTWTSQPSPVDLSVVADLRRLQLNRNELAHISATTGISEQNFKTKWSDIEQVLIRLNSTLKTPNQNLQQTIDDCKNSPLETKTQSLLENKIKILQNIELLVQEVEHKVEELKTSVHVVKDGVRKVNHEVHAVKGEVHKMKDVVQNVQDDINGVKDEVLAVRDEVQVVKDEVREKFQKLYKQVEEIQRNPKEGEDAKEESLKKRNELRDDLITLYRQHYHTLPLSPLFEEHDTPLLDFYVMPDVHRILGAVKEHKSKLTTLREVFYKGNKLCREIYLVADAGLGKTAFSKRLVLTWCQAYRYIRNDIKRVKETEIAAMAEFEFVFLLSLRDCSEECDIDQMIIQQIVPQLANKSEIIETVLSKEKCLVILDGLDEWTHPTSQCMLIPKYIPHRKAREDCTILTTARPWKLDVINIKSSEMDQVLKLEGLSKKSRGRLKKSVITIMTGEKDKHVLRKHICDFSLAVADRSISNLETSPLLLLYLLSLWRDKIDLGRSKCIIYCQMIELLLKRTFKKIPKMKNSCPLSKSDIPRCFDAQTNCRENYTFLSSLGQLAFETLFSKTRENTLVFGRSLVDKYLNPATIDLSLHSGIITQEKERNWTSEIQKTSFSHKTVQEFFAALYISTCSNQDEVLEEVVFSCNSISDILEISKVFIFISGINPKLFSSHSEKLIEVLNEDEITSTYRSVTWPADYDKYFTPVKEIQDLFISCIKEFPESSKFKLCLHDFIFDKSCQQENYYSNLQRMAVQNKNNIKSISIEREGIRSLPEIIKKCGFSDTSINCHKIFYRGECKETELIPLLSLSVKCVTLMSSKWRKNRFECKSSSWSPELSKKVQNNNQLQAIYIEWFKFSHDVLKEFLNYLVNRTSMREIELDSLYCADHGKYCPGFNFDLSQHTELRRLALNHIPLSRLNVNVSLLEECGVGNFFNPDIVKSYLSNISAASKLHIFQCSSLKSSDDVQTMLQTLSSLVSVKHVELLRMNLGERLLPHEIEDIEYVILKEVAMSCSSLLDLIFWIENLSQQVTVDMVDCKITPEEEFEEIKQNIQTSEKFVVIYDDEMADDSYSFEFKSIK